MAKTVAKLQFENPAPLTDGIDRLEGKIYSSLASSSAYDLALYHVDSAFDVARAYAWDTPEHLVATKSLRVALRRRSMLFVAKCLAMRIIQVIDAGEFSALYDLAKDTVPVAMKHHEAIRIHEMKIRPSYLRAVA